MCTIKNSSVCNLSCQLSILLILIFFTSRVWATTTCTTGTPAITINVGTITVQKDSSIGPISGIFEGPQVTYNCEVEYETRADVNLDLASVTTADLNTPGYNNKGVFTTGISGIGVVLASIGDLRWAGGGVDGKLWYILPGKTSVVINNYSGFYFSPKYMSANVTNMIQLIKTSNAISSGVMNVKIANNVMRNTSGSNSVLIPVYLTGTVNVVACSLSTPNINVNLPTINVKSFTAIGKTQGDTPFTVGLQCDVGTKINATLKFTQDTDTTNQSVAAVIGKGSAGSASGVGIQLLYGSTPLNNNTLMFLKTSSGGMELPAGAFTARYFQTKSVVKPGDANAMATLMLTYQ